ncbi:MAG TPA: hypothetical protein PLX79_03745 [Candidatus Dojkabacteria bacterium]|nr:hypothetical protein [Candidatus Dojkabacteria bacterium]
MAGKKGSKFKSSFDTIYDMVFDSSSGKPNKSKPIKLKGSPSGVDLLSDSLVELVSKPAMYFGTAMNDWVGDTYLDSAVVEIQGARALAAKGENTRVGKMKIKLKDMSNFITNPDSMVDKVFEVYKQSTKRSRWVEAGRALDALLVMLAAKRRHNISAAEAWSMGTAAGSFSSLNTDDAAFRNVAKASTISTPRVSTLPTRKKEKLANTVARAVEHSSVQKHLIHGAYTRSDQYGSADAVATRAVALDAFKVQLRKRINSQPRSSRVVEYSDELAEDLFDQYTQTIQRFSPADAGAQRWYYYAEPTGGQGSQIDMAVTPGYTREAGKMYHEAILDSLKIEYEKIASEYQQLMNQYGPLRNLGANRNQDQERLFRELEAKKEKLRMRLRENQADVEHSVDFITVAGVSQTQNGYYNQLRGGNNLERETQRLLSIISSSSALSDAEKQRIIADVNKSFARYSNNQSRITGTMGLLTDPTGGVPKFYHQLVETAINSRIKELNDLIDAGGPSSAILRNEVRALQQELRDYKKFSKRGSYQFTASRLISIYTNLQQISQGNWGELLLNGKLFYDAASPFAPGLMADYKLYTNTKDKILTATDLVQDRAGINRRYASMTGYYYLTPGSFLKTLLWDGGHFNYFAFKAQESMFRYMRNPKFLDFLRTNGFDIDIFLDGGNFDIKKWTPENIVNLLQFFNDNPKLKFGILTNISKKFPALYKQLNRFAALGKIFSLPKRLWKNLVDGKIVPFLKSKVFGKFLEASLIKLFKNNELWGKAVKDFVANKLGMKELVNVAVKIIVQALNLAPGVGTALSVVLSLLAPVIIEKIAKPLFKVFTAMLWGLSILFFALLVNVLILTSNPTKNVTPIDAVMSYSSPESVGKSTGEFDGEYDGDNKPVILEGDCMFDESFFCWQGILGYVDKAYNDKITGDPVCVKTYHSVSFARGVHSLDIHNSAIIKAPDDGIITFVSTDIQCGKSGLSSGGTSGGKVVFQSTGDKEYTITYLHVVPDQSIMENTRVVKGQVLARVQHGLSKSDCWTGDHIHVETSSFDLKKFIESTCGVSQLSCYYGDNPGDITEECKPFWGTQ